MEILIFALLAVIFNILGYEYLMNSGEQVFLLFNVYQFLSVILIVFYWRKSVKQNFIYVYFFITWFIYNSLGLIRASYINTFRTEDIVMGYYVVIFSTLFVFLGIRLSSNLRLSGFEFLLKKKVNNSTFYTLGVIYIIYNIYIFSLSGGFISYFFTDYQDKVPANLKTTMFIFTGIFSYFKYLNIVYFFNRETNSPSLIIVYSFFFFTLITTIASGASLGIMSLILVVFLYKYCLTRGYTNIGRLKKYLYAALCFGILSGVLIRFNRTDYSSFSLDVLSEAKDQILSSPTFDSFGNFILIYDRIDPVYQPNQIIYPFVNFLPRAVFPWKPLELGRIVSYKFYGFRDDEIGGFAPTPMGEFYYDFGDLGILLGMVFVGLILGVLQRKINLSGNSKWKWIFLVAFLSIVSTLPAWYTGFGVRVVYLFFFIMLMAIIERTYVLLRINPK